MITIQPSWPRAPDASNYRVFLSAMQEHSSILSDTLSAIPSNFACVGQGNGAMDYLLSPITSELVERSAAAFAEDTSWRWFGFSPTPSELDPQKVTPDSFFELSLPEDSKGVLDGIILNLQLGWLDFQQIFLLCRQWLKPGGQLFFSTFGPDTLFELREAWRDIDQFAHVHDFPDLHTLGDQLSKSGFEKPILDTDWQGVEFEDIDLLISDLRHQGFSNLHESRRKTLTGKGRLSSLRRSFENQRPVQITFEIIYGYARAPKDNGAGIHVRPPSFSKS